MKNTCTCPRDNAEDQLAGFIDKFTPEMATAIRAVRAALRKRVPTANELVYDNYNFLSSATARRCDLRTASSCWSPMGTACGLRSTTDPSSPIQWESCRDGGNQNRFIRLESARDLAKPEVEAIDSRGNYTRQGASAYIGARKLVIRSVSAKQRPRRVAVNPRASASFRAYPARRSFERCCGGSPPRVVAGVGGRGAVEKCGGVVVGAGSVGQQVGVSCRG